MAARIAELAGGALARMGVEVRRVPTAARLGVTHPDLDAAFAPLLDRAAPESMTSVERMYSLWQAVGHIERLQVPGAFVECGVWRGGSAMLAAMRFRELGAERDLWLYDTFEGMSDPTDEDVAAFSGNSMAAEWSEHEGAEDDPIFAYASLEVVRRNMASTGYPQERVHYIRGKVEDTIPSQVPDQIALLRLDTDWYESTKHELEHLWDRLVPGGVLIIDDYGYWEGCRKAVDEYFAGRPDAPLLHRVDTTGRIAIKR